MIYIRLYCEDSLFQLIFSYVFMPLAVIIGIPWKDCRTVGRLIGKKIIINEFLAYADLGAMINNGDIEVRYLPLIYSY